MYVLRMLACLSNPMNETLLRESMPIWHCLKVKDTRLIRNASREYRTRGYAWLCTKKPPFASQSHAAFHLGQLYWTADKRLYCLFARFSEPCATLLTREQVEDNSSQEIQLIISAAFFIVRLDRVIQSRICRSHDFVALSLYLGNEYGLQRGGGTITDSTTS